MSSAQNQEAGVSRSSSASLSSPPHTSPEPGSPSALFANEQHSITVNPSVDLGPPPPVVVQPPARKKPGSLDCARFAYSETYNTDMSQAENQGCQQPMQQTPMRLPLHLKRELANQKIQMRLHLKEEERRQRLPKMLVRQKLRSLSNRSRNLKFLSDRKLLPPKLRQPNRAKMRLFRIKPRLNRLNQPNGQ